MSRFINNTCVDAFADEMKERLCDRSRKEHSQWYRSSSPTYIQCLSNLLFDEAAKGDPLQVAVFAMMIHKKGGVILPYTTREQFMPTSHQNPYANIQEKYVLKATLDQNSYYEGHLASIEDVTEKISMLSKIGKILKLEVYID